MQQDRLWNEWHPVSKAADLLDDPKQVFVLGERVVIFRNEKGVHAFKDLCIHRGAALSLGKVKNGNLVCAYHAWEYDCVGACVKIPALPNERPIPTKARATVYHCQEQFGLIWVCLGDEPAPLISYPEYALDGYHTAICGPYEVKANAPRIIENFLDVSHLMFVHQGMLGDEEHAQVSDYEVKFLDNRYITSKIPVYQPNPDGRSKGGYANYVYEILNPTTARFTKTTDGSDEEFTILVAVNQEDNEKSKAFMLLTRNYDLDKPDDTFIEFQDLIFNQDLDIVESQKPELLPLDLQAELHLKSDALTIAYRRWLDELGVENGTIAISEEKRKRRATVK
ncbi:aromatic ring-hydroxylating dioxygenase subunit alpha [Robertmurraya yapensis]|uniref:Aromatic ring-hydroxylating dioxygenase subunit alpha n=2 Tax=Bacillaceae TaxID=186817 RepID=A0A431WCD7_9BACI|nr:aromatic ring-hydroxylating dioxygenase subunit alpha [Bacillus yapensis]RTR33150.1 aromatic ring-hydroxylating dioxygenase subunit alpha [Bacillus yapensis]TKS96973.1 aromatic ring-hydroxylating dioxygenase subunit alpha [Bacillus yapensis]